MNRLNQKGFSLVEGLLIVVAVLLLGFGGYYVWNEYQDQSNQNQESSAQDSSTDQQAASEQQTDEVASNNDALGEGGVVYETDTFSITHPTEWVIQEDPQLTNHNFAYDIFVNGERIAFFNNSVSGFGASEDMNVSDVTLGNYIYRKISNAAVTTIVYQEKGSLTEGGGLPVDFWLLNPAYETEMESLISSLKALGS